MDRKSVAGRCEPTVEKTIADEHDTVGDERPDGVKKDQAVMSPPYAMGEGPPQMTGCH